MKTIPRHHELYNPLLKAMRVLGESGSLQEINAKVIEGLDLPPEILEKKHDPDEGNQTEIEYRLAWCRTYLKKYGLIDNSSRGVWSLTPKAEGIEEVDPAEVVRYARSLSSSQELKEEAKPNVEMLDEPPPELEAWRSRLHQVLTKSLDPSAFERLIQRLLRECGFIQVIVTGRTGDGGIDGKGIARIHGLMSFHVVFQCKRYQGLVTAGEIRDFRGAMVGRADKGLFITTGTFTKDALKEATRDGAPPIDLLDGDHLAEKLKEFRLGVTVETVEKVTVVEDWFKAI